MKTTLSLLVCLLGSVMSAAQGYLHFANLAPGVDSPFNDNNGVALTGIGYMVELLAGATAATDPLTPIFAGSFASGYFNAGSVTVPTSDIALDGTSTVLVRVWDSMGGTFTSYAGAVAGGGSYTITTEWSVTPQTSKLLPPAPLVGMPPGLVLVPEPSVLALAALGLCSLLLRRGGGVAGPSYYSAGQWDDYSRTTLDPSDSQTNWTVQSYTDMDPAIGLGIRPTWISAMKPGQ